MDLRELVSIRLRRRAARVLGAALWAWSTATAQAAPSPRTNDGEVLRAAAESEQPVTNEPGQNESEPPPSELSAPSNEVAPEHGSGPSGRLAAGATLTALGGAGLIAGIMMVAVGERPIRTEGPRSVRGRDWRNPAGFIVLGVGAGVLAAGVTLLVLEHVRCKRAPGQCKRNEGATALRMPRPRSWTVVPWVAGRTGEFGVGLMGRFSGRRS